jgi:hypothetical protein
VRGITSGTPHKKEGEAKTQEGQANLERRFRLEPSQRSKGFFSIPGEPFEAEAGLGTEIVPNGGSFAGIGLFPKGTKLIIEADGTLSVNREGLVVSDKAGKKWLSRKVKLNGKELVVFLPDSMSEK